MSLSSYHFYVLIALLLLSNVAAAVGYVTDATEGVHRIQGDEVHALEPGVELGHDDVIATGENDHVQLEMHDGSVLAVGP